MEHTKKVENPELVLEQLEEMYVSAQRAKFHSLVQHYMLADLDTPALVADAGESIITSIRNLESALEAKAKEVVQQIRDEIMTGNRHQP